MVDPLLPPFVTLPCTMCNDELVEKAEPPPKVSIYNRISLNEYFVLKSPQGLDNHIYLNEYFVLK